MNNCKSRGFTLIELMVTLGILAFIVGIAVPTVGSVVGNSDKKMDESTVDMIVKAGMLAQASKIPHDLTMSANVELNGAKEGYTVPYLVEKGFLELSTDHKYYNSSHGVLHVGHGSFDFYDEGDVHTVTFIDEDGNELAVSSVFDGHEVALPKTIDIDSKLFTVTLDKSLTNIMSDVTITVSKVLKSEYKGYTLVSTPQELQNVSKDLNAKYLQINDIDMSGFGDFTPIGERSNSFTGVYDGAGFIIKGLTINQPGVNYTGLFGRTSGATLTRIGLVGGSVIGGERVGGLVGDNRSSNITYSYTTGTVSGTSRVGGLIGFNFSSDVTDSYATGKVSGNTYSGGLVGYNLSCCSVKNSGWANDVNKDGLGFGISLGVKGYSKNQIDNIIKDLIK